MGLEVADLLAFEKAHPRHDGRKEQAIREAFNCSATAYYAALLRACETVEALALDPVTTGRVLRRREALREARRGGARR